VKTTLSPTVTLGFVDGQLNVGIAWLTVRGTLHEPVLPLLHEQLADKVLLPTDDAIFVFSVPGFKLFSVEPSSYV
jgi:hypothetical protein